MITVESTYSGTLALLIQTRLEDRSPCLFTATWFIRREGGINHPPGVAALTGTYPDSSMWCRGAGRRYLTPQTCGRHASPLPFPSRSAQPRQGGGRGPHPAAPRRKMAPERHRAAPRRVRSPPGHRQREPGAR